MKKNKLMLLLVVLVALVAVYFGLSAYNKHAETKKEEEEKEAEIHLVDADSLTKISYTDGSSTMAFVSEDGTWYYDADHEIPIAQSTLDSLETTITGLEAVREIKDPDDLEDYGLTSPLYEISYTDSDDKEHTLHVGDATGENYYASIDDSEKVYTIDSTLTGSLQFDLSEVVDNDTVPSIGSGNLKKVEITVAGETTKYKDEDDLSELAGGFGALSLTAPVDYHVTDETLSNYGLTESERTTATATYKNGDDKETFTVYIGKETGDGNRYLMVDGSKLVYQVSTDIINNMTTVDSSDSADSE